MKTKMFLNLITIQNVKTIQINQISFVKQALKIKTWRLYPCDKKTKEKLAKFTKKNFQLLKINQTKDSNL
jgi:hypothetical protein